MKLHYRLAFAIVPLIILVTIYYTAIESEQSSGHRLADLNVESCLDRRRRMAHESWPGSNDAQPLILWYSTWWSARTGYHHADRPDCANQCRSTGNQSLADCADVLIFHVPDLSRTFRRRQFPLRRSRNQIWMFETWESPMSFALHTDSYADVFNWSLTYDLRASWRNNYVFINRSNGEMVTFDSRYRPYGNGIRVGHSFDYISRLPTFVKTMAPVNMTAKSGIVYSLSNNCRTHSRRETLFRKLRKHVSVDLLGSCFNKTCKQTHAGRCDYDMKEFSKYYFYLAFENSRCKHYISEKAFTNGIDLGVVPVVYGARREDYAAVFPPKSYIFVEDFDSLSALGVYLNHLVANRTAYMEYFSWRRSFTLGHIFSGDFCRLCATLQLFYKNHTHPEPHWYDKDQLKQFFDMDTVCMKRGTVDRKWDKTPFKLS